jgi:hypothetical protein
MGWVSSHAMKPAGDYLLGILKAEGSVPFSRFYNDDTDYAALAKAAGVDESYEDHAHILIEFAAGQIEAAGLVSFTQLEATLIDGERDYAITLTDKGRSFLVSGQRFRYRDMNL